MMQEIAVHLGFAGGLDEGAWGLEENVPLGNAGWRLGWGSFGWGYTMSSPSSSKEVTLP